MMDSQKLACILAAASMTLLGAATSASAAERDMFVTGKKSDTEVQRLVSSADLDLGRTVDRQVLGRRIAHTAWNICSDLDAADGSAPAPQGHRQRRRSARRGHRARRAPARRPGRRPAVAIAITASAADPAPAQGAPPPCATGAPHCATEANVPPSTPGDPGHPLRLAVN